MGAFVKFIFTLIVVGAGVNLIIVLMANAQSQRLQMTEAVGEKELFRSQVKRLNEAGRLQRADILVESQTVDAREVVGETALLVRQYALSREGDAVPMPLVRVKIPGNRVLVDGLMLQFDSLFHEQDYVMLQNTTLVYFARIYGENEAAGDRFSLLHPPDVPDLTRLHPELPRPSFYEIRLWQFIWDLVPDPPRPAAETQAGAAAEPDPRIERALKVGLKVTWLPPDARLAHVGDTWSAFVGSNGKVALESANSPGLRSSMLEEADAIKARQNGVAPASRGTGGL